MTLGNAAAARVRLIVWCKGCQRQGEPEPAEIAARYGAETPVLNWRDRLVCSICGSRQVDMVVTGTERRRASGSNEGAVLPCEVTVGEMFASRIPEP